MTTLCSACNAPIERSAIVLAHDSKRILSLFCECGVVERTTFRSIPPRYCGKHGPPCRADVGSQTGVSPRGICHSIFPRRGFERGSRMRSAVAMGSFSRLIRLRSPSSTVRPASPSVVMFDRRFFT